MNNYSSYQAFIKKRNNYKSDVFIKINDDLINYLYKHINDDCNNKYKLEVNNKFYRLIACDGSQLNFIYELNNKFKANKHKTYTYANLSCLFDVNLKIPINYKLSNDDERSLLISQLSYLNNNDILIADRGYYSENLVNKLNEHNINYVLRISKNYNFYKEHIDKINKSKEGSIYIDNLKFTLFWFKSYKVDDNDLTNLDKLIDKNKNKINELNKILSEDTLKYKNTHIDNVELNKENKENKIKKKTITKQIKKNRILKKELNENINKNNNLIKILKDDLIKLYNEKNELTIQNKSSYIVISNLNLFNIKDIKEIYKKRWEVETHFRFAKELSKLNQMNNKKYDYVNINLLITQFIFLTSGYLNYIIEKVIDKNKMLNKKCLLSSLKNKLIYYLLNSNIKNKEIIIKLITNLFDYILPKIITIMYKKRIRKRPQKNFYNSNVT